MTQTFFGNSQGLLFYYFRVFYPHLALRCLGTKFHISTHHMSMMSCGQLHRSHLSHEHPVQTASTSGRQHLQQPHPIIWQKQRWRRTCPRVTHIHAVQTTEVRPPKPHHPRSVLLRKVQAVRNTGSDCHAASLCRRTSTWTCQWTAACRSSSTPPAPEPHSPAPAGSPSWAACGAASRCAHARPAPPCMSLPCQPRMQHRPEHAHACAQDVPVADAKPEDIQDLLGGALFKALYKWMQETGPVYLLPTGGGRALLASGPVMQAQPCS